MPGPTPRRRTARAALAVLGACLAAGAAADSRTVALTGQMGGRALLVIDGGPPRALAVGASVDGVRLLAVSPERADVEVDGQRRTLVLGASPVAVGERGAAAGAGRRIVLAVQSGGHFATAGSINGRAVHFMVDTGASVVALSQAEAERIGLAYRQAPRVGIRTANGDASGYRVTLDSVRIGDVEVRQIDAVVTPQPMPHILLGNSYLARFDMQRANDRLTLDRRY